MSERDKSIKTLQTASDLVQVCRAQGRAEVYEDLLALNNRVKTLHETHDQDDAIRRAWNGDLP